MTNEKDEAQNRRGEFAKELESLINRYSQENGSDTPDFVLAGYLRDCLSAWNTAVKARERWYGRKCGDGASLIEQDKEWARHQPHTAG
jgi:hypothetical protein